MWYFILIAFVLGCFLLWPRDGAVPDSGSRVALALPAPSAPSPADIVQQRINEGMARRAELIRARVDSIAADPDWWKRWKADEYDQQLERNGIALVALHRLHDLSQPPVPEPGVPAPRALLEKGLSDLERERGRALAELARAGLYQDERAVTFAKNWLKDVEGRTRFARRFLDDQYPAPEPPPPPALPEPPPPPDPFAGMSLEEVLLNRLAALRTDRLDVLRKIGIAQAAQNTLELRRLKEQLASLTLAHRDLEALRVAEFPPPFVPPPPAPPLVVELVEERPLPAEPIEEPPPPPTFEEKVERYRARQRTLVQEMRDLISEEHILIPKQKAQVRDRHLSALEVSNRLKEVRAAFDERALIAVRLGLKPDTPVFRSADDDVRDRVRELEEEKNRHASDATASPELVRTLGEFYDRQIAKVRAELGEDPDPPDWKRSA